MSLQCTSETKQESKQWVENGDSVQKTRNHFIFRPGHDCNDYLGRKTDSFYF